MANWWDIVKTGADIIVSGGKAYLDYKSKKKQNEMIQKSYDDYMAQQKEAAKIAQRAVSTNLTPMTVFNKPSTKADITSFTAVKDGGIMNLKNGSRPTYQEGIGPLVEQVSMQEDVSEVPAGGDVPPELAELIKSLHAEHYERLKAMGKTDEEIMKILMDMAMSMIQADEQGKTPESMGVEVQAEEMIDVKNGGIMGLRKGGRSNYREVGIVDEDMEVMDPESLGDFELKMEEGVNIGPMASGPSDRYEAQIQKLMQEMNISRELAEALILGSDPASIDLLKNLRKGGIAGLRKGGRARYADPEWIVKKSDVEEELPSMMDTSTPEASSPESNTKEFDINDLVISINDNNGVYMGEPIVIQDETTGTWKVMGNDGRVVEFDTRKEAEIYKNKLAPFAKGGRVQRYGGGVMNLGGMEKDYRTTGGFVDIGGRERADDVPARLSRNEFVMTADAVRAAGGGSINKGAQKMYNVMKHLETKGANA